MVGEYLWNHLERFRKDSEGAVTVDWVVLTAFTVLLAVIVMPFIYSGTGNVASSIPAQMTTGIDNLLANF